MEKLLQARFKMRKEKKKIEKSHKLKFFFLFLILFYGNPLYIFSLAFYFKEIQVFPNNFYSFGFGKWKSLLKQVSLNDSCIFYELFVCYASSNDLN